MGSLAEEKRIGRKDIIEVWEYSTPPLSTLETPDWEAWGGGSTKRKASASTAAIGPDSIRAASLNADFEKRLEGEIQRSFEAGRVQGIDQGCAAERAAQAPAQQRLSAQIERMIAAFAHERDRYLHTVEVEVVKLAMAVAARILRRETQMDPLLLTGAVRAALGQLAVSTSVRMRVPPADLELWEEAVTHLHNLVVKPQVLPGDAMRPGDCIVETELGSVDLGVRAQLSEIERGFFDRANSASSVPESVLVSAEQDS